MKALNHKVDTAELHGVAVSVTTYQVGERFYCKVANKDPGATIARGEGASLDEAKRIALGKAENRLQKSS